uniref:Uncharacterized protein n=1 Tax=Chromera velia CCMP2878 TaxID=1169474 RepID=A0A0G4F1M2_9ALVE|eukprot:Cvel_14641.t1-p1 / transcript=Cvel_14641.t1 / gene=Cvel_14641 / organism=Chromera_velia_CCMP2878 / gene_product=hypothetical protein / transcript_product=hypothetical protein / location=Cvel_scaffold1048:24890-26299(+) / protein_length=470 / sequence_SO=supercontig / SO=protein_coding / is_pseudo=false
MTVKFDSASDGEEREETMEGPQRIDILSLKSDSVLRVVIEVQKLSDEAAEFQLTRLQGFPSPCAPLYTVLNCVWVETGSFEGMENLHPPGSVPPLREDIDLSWSAVFWEVEDFEPALHLYRFSDACAHSLAENGFFPDRCPSIEKREASLVVRVPIPRIGEDGKREAQEGALESGMKKVIKTWLDSTAGSTFFVLRALGHGRRDSGLFTSRLRGVGTSRVLETFKELRGGKCLDIFDASGPCESSSATSLRLFGGRACWFVGSEFSQGSLYDEEGLGPEELLQSVDEELQERVLRGERWQNLMKEEGRLTPKEWVEGTVRARRRTFERVATLLAERGEEATRSIPLSVGGFDLSAVSELMSMLQGVKWSERLRAAWKEMDSGGQSDSETEKDLLDLLQRAESSDRGTEGGERCEGELTQAFAKARPFYVSTRDLRGSIAYGKGGAQGVAVRKVEELIDSNAQFRSLTLEL